MSASLDEVLEHIEGEKAIWVRIAATRSPQTGEWQQTMLDLVSGEVPPNFETLRWQYTLALFVALEQNGPTIASWLRNRRIELDDFQIELPEIVQPMQWERKRTLSTYATYQPLPWPVTTVTFNMSSQGQDYGMSDLVSDVDGTPSFNSYYAAATYVFNRGHPIPGGRGTASPMYRHQDTRARINVVTVREFGDSLSIDVEGLGLDGCMAELAGNIPGPSARLSGMTPQRTQLEIPHGLPDDPWVLIKFGGHWLDRRSLTDGYGRGPEPGVVFVPDAKTPLDALIASHENPEVEFKRDPTEQSVDSEVLRVMKTVAAFANQVGGVLLFGVDNDEKVYGIPKSSFDAVTDRLTSLVTTWVSPRPEFRFEEHPTELGPETIVIGLRVDPGEDVPFVAGKPSGERKPYIRPYSQSIPAGPRDVKQMVLSRIPPPQVSSLFKGRPY